ncbi:MAG TPA: hypothetical protein VHG33_07400 [Woeseiaceae bacterium]|nr:hypothetical protein [Woeseiaceae bacterium]
MHIAPPDYGLNALGHTGFFREGAEPLWRKLIEWLEAVKPA